MNSKIKYFPREQKVHVDDCYELHNFYCGEKLNSIAKILCLLHTEEIELQKAYDLMLYEVETRSRINETRPHGRLNCIQCGETFIANIPPLTYLCPKCLKARKGI